MITYVTPGQHPAKGFPLYLPWREHESSAMCTLVYSHSQFTSIIKSELTHLTVYEQDADPLIQIFCQGFL